jgi:NADH dehydrogenase [ubiquinone] 1 alpha subcomplex assembly factor 7
MKIKDNDSFTLDKFIEESLYNKTSGYYMKKNPFGKKGDFITSPNISVLFSEMIAIWVISFWQNLGCPEKFNLIELGAGNGEMMKVLVNTFDKFPIFKNSCCIKILEKSKLLKKKQKVNINKKNIQWLNDLNKLDDLPCIFLANEFFDALPIKQFIKKERKWFERHVRFFNNKFEYFDIPFDMEKFENKMQFKIAKQQNFIEYSPQSTEYLKIINNKIKRNNGGILISFNLINRIVKELSSLTSMNTTQGEFLTKLGILERAEILSKKMLFSEKADIYFRIKRLIDKNQMGELFKVMLITTNKNKFKLGF